MNGFLSALVRNYYLKPINFFDVLMMNEEQMQVVAGQLRQPQGEAGKQVAEKMNEGNAYLNRSAIEKLYLQPDDKVLEIGMGNGFFVKEILFSNPSVRYVGCDFSELMVEQASQLNEAFVQQGQALFVWAEADNLPFAKETFDKVFTANTLYFWENPQTVLSHIGRVLKAGGLFVIAIRPKRTMELLPFVKYGFTMYNSAELAGLLSRNGFTVTSIFEQEEPLQTIAGQSYKMESLIVSAVKTQH